MDLKLEIEKKKTEYEALEAKYRAMEAEKLANEKQLEALKRENAELKERINGGKGEIKKDFEGAKKAERVIDLTDDDLDEDLATQLMIENKVLECEKRKAEMDANAWKSKFQVLQLWVREILEPPGDEQLPLAEKLTAKKEKLVDLVDIDSARDSLGQGIGTPKAAGSPSNYTPCGLGDCIVEEGNGAKLDFTSSGQVRRVLAFENEKSPGKKIAPTTPAVARPSHLGIVDISDSDEEPNNTTRAQLPTLNEGSLAGKKVVTMETREENVEDVETCEEKTPIVSTLKRRRAAHIVMSDSESDDDDDIPISRLKKASPRRRQAPLRKCRVQGVEKTESPADATETKYRQGIPTNVSTEDDESDEADSDSEGESLGGFIVADSDVSGGDNASVESVDPEDGKIDFLEVLSNLRGKKERNYRWEYEADMLADFGKDTELCMKAVCSLYRQQTAEEKTSKETLYSNCRGFSKIDALRGTNLATFLTAGDPQGDLQKSVEELEKHNPKAAELCRSLATQYSKQLFAIYKNKEDPLFLP